LALQSQCRIFVVDVVSDLIGLKMATSQSSISRALLALSLVLWPVDGYLGGIDCLVAGGAAAGPALEEGLEQSDCLG
jgi:hypothetical protein